MRCTTNRCRTNVFDELERGLQQLVRGVPGEVQGSDDPRLTVLELNDHYVVECDLPGTESENISLQFEDSILTISGKRQSVSASEEAKVLFSERAGAEFTRKIRLAKDVDQSAIDAELTNGVLRITIPKRSEVLPQKISIRTAPQSSVEADSVS